MRIAIKCDRLQIDNDGTISGHGAGENLALRLVRVFPNPILIGQRTHRYQDFDMMPVELIDAENTVVINMDVIDSMAVWAALHQTFEEPKVMNFVWWDTQRFQTMVERAALALSAALFPTFCNSERTAHAVKEGVRRLVVNPLAERSKVSWVNLGIRLDRVQPRDEPDIPVVLYPAIYLSERKQPQLFIDVVSKVAKRAEMVVEARLVESHLISPLAMQLSRHRWTWVGPLLPTRGEYWEALSRTTAFLATAREESYGLEYIEALTAGAIGIFPDADWSRAILPEGYPFFYNTAQQAENMLLKTVTQTAACRAELDQAAGGSLAEWLREHHDQDAFESSIVRHVERWFGAKV